MRTGMYSAAEGTGEVVGAALRKLDVTPQAVEFLVQATRIEFNVDAVLVSSNTNKLHRLHFFYNVTFSDGPGGDDGLQMTAGFQWPKEAVVFTDSGLRVIVPFHWGDDEAVVFAEQAFGVAFAINNTEFVTLADYAISYVLDFHASEAFRFSDLSVAWTGVFPWNESVTVFDSLTTMGGNSVALSESVSISEVMMGGPAVIFGDAVYMAEWWTYVMDFQVQPDSVTWTDALVVSQVAATDARPGAFIPGSALLGSPT